MFRETAKMSVIQDMTRITAVLAVIHTSVGCTGIIDNTRACSIKLFFGFFEKKFVGCSEIFFAENILPQNFIIKH